MKPVKSVIEHNPPESYGDCFRACIASILELPAWDVPHFSLEAMQDGESEFDRTVELCREFVAQFALGYVDIPFKSSDVDEMLRFCARFIPGCHYVMTANSERGFAHCVVGYGGEIVFDPTYGSEEKLHGLVGGIRDEELETEFIWIGLIVRP